MGLACLGTSVSKCVLPMEKACFLEQAFRCVLIWCGKICVCVFSWMWNRRARNECFPAFVFWPYTFVSLNFWTCWVPQNGATALFVSAQNGCKKVVEVLVRNGAEVSAPCEVICDEWRDLSIYIYIRALEMQWGVWECICSSRFHWANSLWIGLGEVSLCEFAHPCM